MNFKSATGAAVLGGAIAFAVLAGGTVQSQAAGLTGLSGINANAVQSEVQQVGHRKRRFRFHNFHKHSFGHGHGCGYYKWKWHETGSFFWKKKYFICKGWW